MPPDDSGMVYLLEQLRESVEQAHVFRKELRESLETWKEEVTAEIREYKRTVSSSLIGSAPTRRPRQSPALRRRSPRPGTPPYQ